MADFGHPFQQPADLKQSNSKEAQRRQEKGLVRASGGKLRRLRLLESDKFQTPFNRNFSLTLCA
ncbi:hypothetical protein RUM43_002714 [Polyplax serrata]|uniref:Uncharacterized protein n=1 Tax=Polyplax serrata TaxID=468196 RepID=A0AAN8S513_POLSC